MKELFEIQECKSPRLKWMEKHGVVTNHAPEIEIGIEDEFGNEIYPWIATDKPYAKIISGKTDYGVGHTEEEAICDLARLRRWKLWNEL